MFKPASHLLPPYQPCLCPYQPCGTAVAAPCFVLLKIFRFVLLRIGRLGVARGSSARQTGLRSSLNLFFSRCSQLGVRGSISSRLHRPDPAGLRSNSEFSYLC
jgi:hypothetical protein